MQVSLSTVFSFGFMLPVGQLVAHFPQDTQISFGRYILFNEYFDNSPRIVPTGHIFEQKNLFLKKTIARTIIAPTIPASDKVMAEPKSVYGSRYLITIAQPPARTPKHTAAIKYLTG